MELNYNEDTHNFIFVGESGSGKTEISANLALQLAKNQEKSVYMIDMDQTKSLFRARDFSSMLKEKHVYMAENPELWDSPLMPQGLSTLLQDEDKICVVDVGGNAMGAAMMGQFAGILAENPTRYYYVINPCRAYSGCMEEIEESLRAILISARIPMDRLEFIANPYMGKYTTGEMIVDYYKKLETELEKAGLKTSYLAVSAEFYRFVCGKAEVPVLEVNTYVDKLYI